MTYAHVADKLHKATNEDQLAEAADLIQYVGSTKQRDELGGIYKRKADVERPRAMHRRLTFVEAV